MKIDESLPKAAGSIERELLEVLQNATTEQELRVARAFWNMLGLVRSTQLQVRLLTDPNPPLLKELA